MPSPPPLTVHPDRFLPADPATRSVARRLLAASAPLPIVSPHGHVDARTLLDDEPFTDAAALFVTPDHYVTRLLHADGVPLDALGVGRGPLAEEEARAVWRELCRRWDRLAGTPARAWLEAELALLFEVGVRPSAATADAIFDHVGERLGRPDFRPRALYRRFGIEVLATTDDPCADLAAHAALAADGSWEGRVVPTFRPDRYLEVGEPAWTAAADRLATAADQETDTYAGYLAALEDRRRHFIAHGATSADHSHEDLGTEPLAPQEAERIYRAARAGAVTEPEATAFRRHMVAEMARMSCQDGLVMTLHPGVRRNHHRPTFERFGPDTGHDVPLRGEATDALRPLLERYGTHPGLHLVVFTLDEGLWGRELAPLAGFYPCLYVGVPWWHLDAPDAMRRFRAAVTEVAGFHRTSGFVDDTRAFCSIPARHDTARRIDAGYLAQLVVEHRLDEDEALDTARLLAHTLPKAVFKL